MERQGYAIMKKIFVFSLVGAMLLAGTNCARKERKSSGFPDYLKNSNWLINSGELITLNGETTYSLLPKSDTATIYNFHAVSFMADGQFKSYDSWECGNDCFTETYGRYYFTDTNEVKMELDSITRSGTCAMATEIFSPSAMMSFNIVKQGEQLELIRKKR
ncbi:hypothetical protein CLV99_4338 [Sphingobacterium yanglingense]|uniref:Lipocalin-like protein n=2 Tax=Sphingobacterium yanglingense TaxID=1437280 RepID=A0A4R6WF49_9SPHI|nr:hypothetical protein CLV99_4338 [Sphingobacterium yanglingense]